MEDKQELTIEKYGFRVKSKYKARGAVILDTSEGLCLMREHEKITGHFEFENKIKNWLFEHGMELTDLVLANQEGELITEWETGEKYVVYRWYQGDSCDYQKDLDLQMAAENLGRLHRNLRDLPEEIFSADPVTQQTASETLESRYERYNRELKRVYQFMKQKKRKSEFELKAMSCFHEFYEKAQNASQELVESEYVKKHERAIREICHGCYNYHNLIYTRKGVATTNFESADYGLQMMDLAYFLRKVMEKNGWQEDKGDRILNSYTGQMPMGKEDIIFLRKILSYPVKYRKLMNQYINGKKSWISDKNMEKLTAVRQMESAKENFLRNMGRI